MSNRSDSDWGKHLTLGLQLGIGAALGLTVGSWIDRKYGWEPWGVLVGVFLGLSAGMYQLIREGIRANRD